MKKDAVQHERAPRPSVAAQHHLALQKLGYNFTRQQSFIPSPTPMALSTFPPLHPYNGLISTLPESSVHNSFMDRSSFQDFPTSRLPETLSADVSQLNPLLGTHVGALSPLNPFKIPLFSASLHYPVPHPGYIPTNILYPPIITSDSSPAVEKKPDPQVLEKIKEDEVSSSEEACKAECQVDDGSKDDLRSDKNSSPTTFEPPAQVISKKLEKHCRNLETCSLADYHNERQRIIRIIETPNRSSDELTKISTRIKNHCHSSWKFDEGVCDPAAKVLVASIKWLHGVGSFVHMKPTEQTNLLRSNWKELFILTAAEFSFHFDEDEEFSIITSKRPYLKTELQKLSQLLKRLSLCKLDKSELDWLRSTLLFRSDAVEGDSKPHIEMLQEQFLLLLQKHCGAKDPTRFGKVMMLLPNICCTASKEILEHLLFPSSSSDDVHSILSRILMYTSM
ncbi:uncharacterized protein LOC142986625 [Anticarsia gemmatalis]|uniref:uncharacterized protein LOC142986625 n=1 Tax=Anticarsia gemmatalis TaxID=129554 RepID=UPI003F759B8A